jgi:hypothetical protein
LTSCGSADDETTPEKTATFTPTKTNTPSPTSIPTNSPTPTATEIPCFTLIAPEDGAEFGTMGLITFQWTALDSAWQFGASQYQIEITFPSRVVESKKVEETTYERWLESLPPGGEYGWRVNALDKDEGIICTAGHHAFTKPQYVSQSSNGDSDGSDGGKTFPCDPWPSCWGESTPGP